MKRRYCDESGYILVLAIFVVMGLLAVTMLAIDMGNIYIWRVRLERAAKAGVAAGLGYRTLNGWQAIYGGPPQYTGQTSLTIPATAAPGLTTLKSQMTRVFEETIKATNYSSEFSFTINPSDIQYNLAGDEAALTVELKVPTLLIGRLEVFGLPMQCNATTVSGKPACSIKVTERASLTPATIVLALDTSGSMECEVATSSYTPLADCACRTSSTVPCGGTDGSKKRIIDELKEAVINFHEYFNPVRDRIAIVPFNLGAKRSYSFMEGVTPSSFGNTEGRYNNFLATIGKPYEATGLIPFGNTNPCDAFIMAAEEINEVRANTDVDRQGVRPQIVFFTDGSPNAMRGAFTSEDSGRLTAAKPSTSAPNDWYQYSVEWEESLGDMYRAPGPLFHASFPLFNKTLDSDGYPMAPPPTGPTPTPAPGAPTPAPTPTPARCGEAWFERPGLQFVGSLSSAEPTPAPSRTNGCLTSPSFTIPGAPNYGVSNVSFKESNILYTNQLPYLCTIEAADYIRQQLNGTVFALGLGKTAASCFNDDPFQDADNAFLRKDNFLSRVALDPVRTVENLGASTCSYFSKTNFQSSTNVSINSCPAHSLDGKSFKVTYDHPTGGSRAPNSFPPGTEGEYLGIEDPLRLKVAFARIAKQILLRLNN